MLVSLVVGAARGFLFNPTAGGGELKRAAGRGGYSSSSCAAGRIAMSPLAVRETRPHGGVCRMTAEAEEEAGGGEGEGEAEVVVPEAAADPSAENEDSSSTPEMPELLTPTREELESAFPDIPQAPYPTLPDPREMTSKQIEAAALQDVNYGGLPAARRANIDFERSERERIHFETATRVMNYEIQAERAEVMLSKNKKLTPAEARRLRRADLKNNYYGLIEVTEEDEGVRADYTWDQEPELITFSAYGVLYNWHLPMGLLMREALGRSHNYVHRMPPPGAFQKHFKESHEDAAYHIPCYGAHENMSSWDWWFHVFTDAYLKTINEFYMDEDIVLDKIDDLVDELYYEITVGPEAFEVMPLVKVVLDRLAAWRDNEGGPKLAVVADDDDRLHVVLENLGLLPYFDFVLTSRETGYEPRETNMYEIALETAGVKQAKKGLHVGCKYETDITGSCEAGMEAVSVKRCQTLYERPNEPYEFHRVYEIGELLNRLGLPQADEEYMSRRRGNFWEEEEDDDDEDFLDEFYGADDGLDEYAYT
ncbi:unnamed protein product [Ectocarpus sp. CCAP 1310/34]|nr:unnamed protein product [Ectocarpus sp. CCAP 1310/34]